MLICFAIYFSLVYSDNAEHQFSIQTDTFQLLILFFIAMVPVIMKKNFNKVSAQKVDVKK